ncbi:tyrosine-type recombinase/integrase [Stenotrophomonas sp. MMGLT7]|uniref:tyrosine-type recombinase/integrase n=1 Tax=Stenotrophomonas sp. MMGLT7 TaxID=2901227 RepID=UPI001E339503|nr:tyrosine-type recombinase/integrase [Stenotrophomonas sp. MMGLT7]
MRYLRALGRSNETARKYVAAVDRFVAFSATVPDNGSDIDPLMRFVAARRDALRPASVNLEISALRRWFAWLRDVAPDAWQPSHWPKGKRGAPRLVRALSDAEVGLLLAAPDLSTYVGLRDHVIMATLYQCGLRAGELAGLQLGSVLDDGFLLVFGKGNKERLVPYGKHWRGLLETYLRQRSTTKPGKRNALFLTAQGRPLRDARSVWVIVNRYARRALGLACGYARLEANTGGRPWQGHYPHLLRASFATELHRRGVNIIALSQLLGHASAVTTALYLGVDLQHLRTAVSQHPRAMRAAGA